jgi:hypothetical protein
MLMKAVSTLVTGTHPSHGLVTAIRLLVVDLMLHPRQSRWIFMQDLRNAPANACGGAGANGAARNGCGANPNTTELYLAQNFTFGPLTGFAKVSYSLSNIFGINNSSGSVYPDLTLNYDTGVWGLALNGHVGYQYVSNTQTLNGTNYNFSYTDWKLGVTKDFGGGLSGNVSYVGTTNPSAGGSYLWYVPASNGTTKSAGQGGGLISLTKTF